MHILFLIYVLTLTWDCRICVGRHVSNNSMFIEIAALLWAFNITPAKDAKGNDILPDPMDSVDEGLVVYVSSIFDTLLSSLTEHMCCDSRPVDFPCTITPRSTDVESVVAHTMELHGLTS